MQERHNNRARYFDEQSRTTEKYYIPYILKVTGQMPTEVLEVGCGEGGNLVPFARSGCKVTGVDIASSRIRQAREFFAEKGLTGTFIDSDIFKLHELRARFSLILVHDVIEHISDKRGFLQGLKQFLAPDGVIFIAFPAWQMPFGGHQQIARSRWVCNVPFLHLLPTRLYKGYLELCKEHDDTIQELLSIKKTRCPIELFRKVLKQCGYQEVSHQYYFINPHYETKFGLKPRKLYSLIGDIPYLRNFFCTSCFYLIR